jgi:hypothetical protein
MLCQYCEDITIENLIKLDKEDRKSSDYGMGAFASSVYYAHHPIFDSLIISAEEGCNFCAAIYTEFRVANLLKDITKKKEFGLDTNVSICIGVSNKTSKHPDQVYDRILAGVGFVGDLLAQSWFGKDLENESDVELDNANNQTLPDTLDDANGQLLGRLPGRISGRISGRSPERSGDQRGKWF